MDCRYDILRTVGMIYLGRLGIEVCKRAEGILGGHMGKGGLQDRIGGQLGYGGGGGFK